MGVLDEGFLGLEIDGSSTTVNTLNNIITSVALLMQCTIGMIAFRKMTQYPDVDSKLKLLFFCSVLCAVTYTVTKITLNTLVMVTGWESMVSVLIFAMSFFLFLCVF